MSRALTVALFALALLAAPLAVESQPPGKVYRIGVLSSASAPIPVDHPAFLRTLRELGYMPGQNLILEDRYAGGPSGFRL